MLNQTVNMKEQFSELLDNYQTRSFRRGEIVTGTIVYLEDDIGFVDIGANQDAIVPAWDLNSLDTELLAGLQVGSQIQVYITETPAQSENLVVSIRRGLKAEDWQRARLLLESGEAQEFLVTSLNQGGLLVAFGEMDGFVPNSQVLAVRRQPQSRRDEFKQQLLGSPLLLKVIDMDEQAQRLVLSEAAARSELRQKMLKKLQVGQIVTGQVVSLVPFGVFLDLGGVDGLVHISQLDWTAVASPDQVVQEGQELEVRVIGVDAERERISLSRKALLPNPWEQFAQEHEVGELLEGSVQGVREFGVFVRLNEAIVGLVHVDEMGDTGDRLIQDVFEPGDAILVRIIKIQPERERVGLSTRQNHSDSDFPIYPEVNK